jgi:hypothetical protein
MNSVDFYLNAELGKEPRIAVGGNTNQLVYQEGATVVMPPGVDAAQYHGMIVECAWDKVGAFPPPSNQLVYQEGATVVMPPGVDAAQYHGMIVECAWDKVGAFCPSFFGRDSFCGLKLRRLVV